MSLGYLVGCRPAIVGLTDQQVHQRTSHKHYMEWYVKLQGLLGQDDCNRCAHAPGGSHVPQQRL